jgi:hypothetical protein
MDWQEWFELCAETVWPSSYGIYRIRMTTQDGTPILIARLGGVDPDGVLDIGRSGLRTAKSDRSLGRRLWEFWQGRNHSAAYTYGLARVLMAEMPRFCGHRLWASVLELADEAIEQAERDAIRAYFDRFLELPPYNAAFPGR